jgi:hypothetical protein
MKRKIRKQLRKPFKGSYFYEWQIGPIVFQVKRKGGNLKLENYRKVHIWRDRYWRS